jgi:hypothetical protein
MAGVAIRTHRIGISHSPFAPGGIPHHLAGQPISLLLCWISRTIYCQSKMDTAACYLRLPLPGREQVLHLLMTQGALKPAQGFG